ncbi:acyltransferase [Chitinimonas sp.]|uniref:acyltransferase n=1 Tax=Chitinimonas sp. TaxID=1934313 RepID=UPI0035B3A31D
MLAFLPAPLRGLVSLVLLAINVVLHAAIIVSVGLIKFLLPLPAVRRLIDPLMNRFAESWIACNNVWIALAGRVNWRVTGDDTLRYAGWYLVESNHQSWVDIFVLQKVLNRRIPFLKFFLKQQLIFVPVIGLAWWALDFPFMRRHSEAYMKKNPHKRGEDQATTRRACQKFSLVPTSVMNFLEGTRFTAAKHAKQQSPFQHLLKPKAGGIALAMNAMGEQFQSLLDITIHYPQGVPSFWGFLCGKLPEVVVLIDEVPIPRELTQGDYSGDPVFRAKVQDWVQALWQKKDATLAALHAGSGARR